MIKTSIATSIKYGNYKDLFYKANRYKKSVERNWALVCRAVGLPEDTPVEVHFRPIKGSANGNYNADKNRICIDPRCFSFTDDMYRTLAHEAQHLKQHKDGVLDHEWCDKTCKWLTIWKGKAFKQASTYNAYRNRPWEVEAREAGRIGRTAYINRMKEGLRRNKKAQILPKNNSFPTKPPEEHINVIINTSNISSRRSSRHTSNKDNRQRDNRYNSNRINRKSNKTSRRDTSRRIGREPSIEPLINTEEWKYRNTPKYKEIKGDTNE